MGAAGPASRPAAVAAALAALRTLPADARAIRRLALEQLHAAGEAEGAFYWEAVEHGGLVMAGDYDVVGRPDRMAAGIETLRTPTGFAALPTDPRRPRVLEHRSFLEDTAIMPADRWKDCAFYHAVYVPNGVGSQLRLRVYQGGRFLAHVAVARVLGTPDFGPAERRRLQPLVAPVLTAFTAASALDEAPGSAHLLARPDGTVELVTAGARAWLERPGFPEALRQAVRAAERGQVLWAWPMLRARAHLVRVESGALSRYVVAVTPLTHPAVEPALALTTSQRAVAELAAAGATAEEIARHLGRSSNTVRSLLRVAYRRLGVRSRPELARALEDRPRAAPLGGCPDCDGRGPCRRIALRRTGASAR